MIRIALNGDTREVDAGISVEELVRELSLADRPCAVEVNKRLIPKADRAAVRLSDGDAVEIVTLVGGG